MTKAHDKNTGLWMVIIGLLAAYLGYGGLKGNIFQTPVVAIGILLILVGGYTLVKALGLIQTGKKV